ncbi:MAG: DUF2339 domain-containing protein [Bryobacteraceae bacterium]
MPDPEIDRLRSALEDIERRVAALESRSTVPAAPVRAPTDPQFAITVLNRIGAVTLIVGLILFFKFAADNRWIGAAGLISLGLLAGFALVAAGEWLRRKNQQTFAQGVAGCGFAVIYTSAYAAFAYSQLISRSPDFIALVAASALAIALSFHFASAAIAAVGFIGAFLAPLLLRTPNYEISPWLYFIYLLLLTAISVFAARRLHPFLAPFNALWAILCAWILVDAQYFVLFTIAFAAAYFSTASRVIFYLCGHACLLIAALRQIAIWAGARTSLASEIDSLFLATYAVIMIASAVFRASTVDRLLALALIGMVVAKLYLYDVWQLARFYRISAFVALGVLLLAASFLYSRHRSRPLN